jgi:hypothetical protein
MKKASFFVPVILSLVAIGAHFLRYDILIGVAGVLLLIALLFVRRPWVARMTQVVLVIGALEWLRTLYELLLLRVGLGQPFLRMSIILGIVAVVTICSALLFQSVTMKKIYRLERGSQS